MAKVLVIGSINMDLVAQTKHFPKPGETVNGEVFNLFPGGKGGNQAVAAGRLGADVAILGKVGDDHFGKMALEAMAKAGVDISRVEKAEGVSTGIALIEVSKNGENAICYIAGANNLVDTEYIRKNKDAIDQCDFVLMQLEIPMETVEWAAAYASSQNKTVIFDPAPAGNLPNTLLKDISVITPNTSELELVTGTKIKDQYCIHHAANVLLKKGTKLIIHKAGRQGAYQIDKDKIQHYPGFLVKTVDTTAAGDTFNAAVAVALSNGKDYKDAVKFANAAAAVSVTKLGAQSAMPSAEEVHAFIHKLNVERED